MKKTQVRVAGTPLRACALMMAVFILVAPRLAAEPVTDAEVQDLVLGWLKESEEHLGKCFGQNLKELVAYANEAGETVYYVVYVDPSGFVIVSADDLVEPVIAFTDEGAFDHSYDSPLGAMVNKDVPGRLARAKAYRADMAMDPVELKQIAEQDGDAGRRVAAAARSRWQTLKEKGRRLRNWERPSFGPGGNAGTVSAASAAALRPRITGIRRVAGGGIELTHDATTPVTIWKKTPGSDWQVVATGVTAPVWTVSGADPAATFEITIAEPPTDGEPVTVASISDVRVAPLLQSKWSQSTAQSHYCYNYYTPNHCVCGCVATAMAQVMRYHRYPVTGIGLLTRTCELDSVETNLTTRGGNGSGGAYNWDLMPLVPASAPYSDAQWSMIGSLCYDAGVCVHMMYTLGSSGAYMSYVYQALKNDFGYSNACYYYNVSDENKNHALLNSNLAADHPLLLSISRPGGGHAICCDGFGYDGGVMYHHLNMGWAGSSDAWYDIPDIGVYDTLNTITYNVFTNAVGEIIAGRVVDQNGAPITGAQVAAQAQGGGPTYSALTDDKGYYGIIGVPSNTTFNVEAWGAGYGLDTLENISTSNSSTIVCGNYWGADFTLTGNAPMEFSAVGLQTSVYLSWSDPRSSAMPNSTVYIRRKTTGYPAHSADGTQIYTGTAQSHEDPGLTPGQPYYYTLWLNDGSPYAAVTNGEDQATATPEAGRLKLFWHNQSSGYVCSWMLASNGTNKHGGLVASDTIASSWKLAGTGDIDQDGCADILWHNQTSGLVCYWLLNADATRGAGGSVSADTIAPSWQLSGVGDIDRDGTSDVIWHNQSSGLVVFWLLNADGTRKSGGLVTADAISPTWQLSGVGDIDRDGSVDLLWHNQQSGLVVYWLLNATGTLKSDGLVTADAISPTWQLSGVGDIDRDGSVDLLWHNQQSGLVVYWLLNATGTLKSGALVSGDAISPTWQLSGVGDIDNDGTVDLIWHNQRSGLVVYWLLNPTGTLKSDGLVSPEAIAPTWRLSGVGY
ncbi:MAG: C10 family peptidase [Kiritimatiellae bacterium]|nr:C10 family peptidase [Kiritimatiellia bacterium]